MPEQETHSRLAPSAAKQWTNCTASIKFIKDNEHRLPEGTGSSYANEGTIAHEWCANILDGLNDISEVPEDMRPHVAGYVELAERITTDKDSRFVEAKVPLFYKPDNHGTVDFALLSDERVYILDLKYGAGVIVDAKGNTQLAIYAMSLIKEFEDLYDFTDETLVTMTIYQPRTYEGSPMKVWAVTLGQLKDFCKVIEDAAFRIQHGTEGVLEFAPSDSACQWCAAKGICKARAEHLSGALKKEAIDTLEDLSENPEELEKPSFEALTERQVSTIVKYASEIKSWLNSVESEAHKALEAGKTIEGLKLVQGKEGNRQWLSEEDADKLIKTKLKADERYTKKLITLPQAEKLLKGQELSTRFTNRFKELTFRKPAKPTLALESDPREAINTSAETVLPNLDGEDLM